MIPVFEFPPNAGCRIRVSLLSRYGTCPLQYFRQHITVMKSNYLMSAEIHAYPWLSVPSLNFLITVPKIIRLLLMWEPSFKRTPSAPVFAARSEPARSTKFYQSSFKNQELNKARTTETDGYFIVMKIEKKSERNGNKKQKLLGRGPRK